MRLRDLRTANLEGRSLDRRWIFLALAVSVIVAPVIRPVADPRIRFGHSANHPTVAVVRRSQPTHRRSSA